MSKTYYEIRFADGAFAPYVFETNLTAKQYIQEFCQGREYDIGMVQVWKPMPPVDKKKKSKKNFHIN